MKPVGELRRIVMRIGMVALCGLLVAGCAGGRRDPEAARWTGLIAGGIAGLALGSQVGGGASQDAAMVLGAGAGAVLGQRIATELSGG